MQALLSPSRRGLQGCIVEAGSVRPLLDLLASWCAPPAAATPLAPADGQSDGTCDTSSAATGAHPPLTAWRAAPHVLAPVLRTLVNLTSNPRIGNPVRQV